MIAVGQGDRRASPAELERGTGGVFVTHCELLESKATMMDKAWPIAKNTTSPLR